MTYPISKRLLMGVIATSFIIINCQKAPARKVMANNTNQKVSQNSKLVACTKEMITAIDDRAKTISDITAILADKSKIDDPQKQNLQNLINSLYQKSKSVYDLFGAAKADGCNRESAQGKKAEEAKPMQDSDLKLASNVQQITGISNDILDNQPIILGPGKTMFVSAEMADLLSDEKNLNGAKMIVDGAIADGGAEYEKMVANRAKTSCIVLSIDKQKVDANSAANIIAITPPQADAKTKRNVVQLQMALKAEGGDRPFSLACNMADSADANKELVNALGKLLSPKKAADAADVNGTKSLTTLKPEEAAKIDQLTKPAPAPAEAAPVAPAPKEDPIKEPAAEALKALGSK